MAKRTIVQVFLSTIRQLNDARRRNPPTNEVEDLEMDLTLMDREMRSRLDDRREVYERQSR